MDIPRGCMLSDKTRKLNWSLHSNPSKLQRSKRYLLTPSWAMHQATRLGNNFHRIFTDCFFFFFLSFFKGFKRDWLIRALKIPKIKTVPICITIKQRAHVTHTMTFFQETGDKNSFAFLQFMSQGLIFILFYFYFINLDFYFTLNLCPHLLYWYTIKTLYFYIKKILLVKIIINYYLKNHKYDLNEESNKPFPIFIVYIFFL